MKNIENHFKHFQVIDGRAEKATLRPRDKLKLGLTSQLNLLTLLYSRHRGSGFPSPLDWRELWHSKRSVPPIHHSPLSPWMSTQWVIAYITLVGASAPKGDAVPAATRGPSLTIKQTTAVVLRSLGGDYAFGE